MVKTGAVNGVRSVARTLGILPERFLPTVWELIPYSFVVDYFVNVGDIVASYAFQRNNIVWGFTGYKVITTRKYSDTLWYFKPYPDGYYPGVKQLLRADVWGGGAELNVQSYTRDNIHSESFMPDLSIHLPFSNKAWINLGALLTQKFCSLF
jgi:hypothetical protein